MALAVSPFSRALSVVAAAAMVMSGISLISAAPVNAAPAVQVVTGNDIRPNETTYPGWHEGSNNTVRAFFVAGDGLHLGVGTKSQILNGLDSPQSITPSDLGNLITGASVTTTGGLATLQVPLFFGSGTPQSFTTLRSADVVTGVNTFDLSSRWITSSPIGTHAAREPGTTLANLLSALESQSNIRLLGFGVQAPAPAVVPTLSWGGTTYNFAPAVRGAATPQRVTQPEIALDESNYLVWHQGYPGQYGVNQTFAVGEGGLILTPGNDSVAPQTQILKGLTTPVAGAGLYALLTSYAAVTVGAGGDVTYQVPVSFNGSRTTGEKGWSTLRSLSLSTGAHTFSLNDQWVSSNPIGTTILAGGANNDHTYALGDILDALNAQADALAIGFGVQTTVPALVKDITWYNTRYYFDGAMVTVPAGDMTAGAVTISGMARAGTTLTANTTAWTPSSVALTYQWLADGNPISGAIASTFHLFTADAGKKISVTVTGTSTGYTSKSATSAETDAVLTDVITVDRLSGANRYDTAAAIAAKFATATKVYIATGEGYADALSAGPVASHFAAPLLLTRAGVLPDVVKTQLLRLKPAQIVIVGGLGVVSSAVEAQLKGLNVKPEVRRVSGSDRYATSRALATDTWGASSLGTAYLATGTNFPDALSAGPAAAHFDGPVILVRGTASTIDAATRALLTRLGVDKIKIAGGTGVINAAIEAQAKTIVGASNVTRNGAGDRYSTSVAINLNAFVSASTIYLATGSGYADALAGSALAGTNGAPLFVTQKSCIPATTLNAIRALGATKVVLLGGTGVLTAGVERLTSCG